VGDRLRIDLVKRPLNVEIVIIPLAGGRLSVARLRTSCGMMMPGGQAITNVRFGALRGLFTQSARDVREVPPAPQLCARVAMILLDHFVGAGEKRRRHLDAERL